MSKARYLQASSPISTLDNRHDIARLIEELLKRALMVSITI